MIASVRGVVLSAASDSAVIDVGGVGLLVQGTPTTIAGLRVGDIAQVATSLVVREDSLTLYGFADHDERSVFESVQTVSGIGPRIALAMLAALRPDDIRRAVAGNELATLTKVPGIGSKGAQRLVLELKDRLAPPTSAGSGASTSLTSWSDSVHAALVGLGWSVRDADDALERVRAEVDAGRVEPEVPQLLRAALRSLDRG